MDERAPFQRILRFLDHLLYTDHGLSFTDVMTVVLVERHSIDSVLSFDDDFDGLVDRLDPPTVPTQE